MPFEGNEEQIAQLLRYEDIIGSAHAEGAPDLLDTLGLENQDPTGQPTTEIGVLFHPLLDEGTVKESDQFRGQASLQPDHGLGSIAQTIVGVRQQFIRRVQRCEVNVGVVLRTRLAAMSGAQPDDHVLLVSTSVLVDPRRSTM